MGQWVTYLNAKNRAVEIKATVSRDPITAPTTIVAGPLDSMLMSSTMESCVLSRVVVGLLGYTIVALREVLASPVSLLSVEVEVLSSLVDGNSVEYNS